MKHKLFAAVLLLALCAPAFAQNADPKKSDAKKPAAKVDPAMLPVTDEPGLPRVLLIGDSISIGYTVPVRAALKGRANVHRILTNGGPTPNGLKNLKAWLGDGKWDVIHFNWGLHDLKYMDDGRQQVGLEDYEKNLRELIKQLKATGAKLIWCSTTPVPDAKLNPPRKNDDVLAFNAVAKKVMEENGIATDDLYTHAAAKLAEIQLPANVHYNKDGYEYLAKQVVASIEKALPKK
ncbi:MAG: SGNH/GDSL hydrolase family protein [Verrucomicrobia bacterium]|nr:SGNH/GDSL hydrolase family protein [Verrucomicrobiota bacterium]